MRAGASFDQILQLEPLRQISLFTTQAIGRATTCELFYSLTSTASITKGELRRGANRLSSRASFSSTNYGEGGQIFPNLA